MTLVLLKMIKGFLLRQGIYSYSQELVLVTPIILNFYN